MPLRSPVASPVMNPVGFAVSRIAQLVRWIYNFDGATNRGVFANRLINPDGNIRIEWSLLAAQSTGSWACIVSQSILDNGGQREFGLYVSPTGALEVRVGGNMLNISNHNFYQSGRYAVEITVNRVLISFNQALIADQPFTRGSAREPSAPTVIGARPNNSMSSLTAFFRAVVYDVRINGTLYPMGDRNQAIQLPSPSGLGPELITQSVLENPNVKGSQWTYLGDGRWQLVGDGSLNSLQFLHSAQQPFAGFIEFEVESISGGSITSAQNTSSHIVNSVGIHRRFYTDLGANLDNMMQFKRGAGSVNCVIKNISLRPLGVLSVSELVTNGNFAVNTSAWFANGGGSLSWSSGQAILTCVAGQNSRFEQSVTLEAGALYIATADVVAMSGTTQVRLNMIRGLAGNYAGIGGAQVSAAGTRITNIFRAPATDAMIQLISDGANTGSFAVDNISLRKFDAVCTPLTLVNTTSPGWQLFDPNAPLPSFNFSLQNNSQYLPFI